MMFLIVTPPYDRAFPIQSLDEVAPGRLKVLPERVYYSFLQLISSTPVTAISILACDPSKMSTVALTS